MIRIIIADDELIERTILHKKLNNAFGDAAEIAAAKNGREVLELYEEKRADLLILDINMPGISGLEAAKRIRMQDRDCAIIFLTAFDEFEFAKKAFSVRAMDYLLKPCDDAELISAVEEAMPLVGRRRQQPELTAINNAGGEMEAFQKPETTADLQGLQKMIRRYISENYMYDFGVPDIAEAFGYSEGYFCRLFRQYFGSSFLVYLTGYRIEKAKDLLRLTDLTVKEVGNGVGYEDANYFAKVFRRVAGVSPTDFRAQAKAENTQS